MQLIARSENATLVAAGRAARDGAYSCLECGAPVRLRGGPHRQLHFYHVRGRRRCRQSGKSTTHLAVQHCLLSLLPYGEGRLEVPFQEIGRVADLYWEREGIVFEVQCSPISAEEVERRTLDYRQLGLQVVWILHAGRYNRRRLSAAEEWLADHPHYFTTIDPEGKGLFFDQWAQIEEGIRTYRLPPFSIDLSRPKRDPRMGEGWPRRGSLYFSGDLVDRLVGGAAHLLEGIPRRGSERKMRRWLRLLLRPYWILLRVALEAANDAR